mmetsp:Transcript_39884/g.87052  ORF Transcript_39884/g.87052 Transcript_39884/m.87052 type:complete len:344 (-) Transcript_39884:28-1059(-)
MPRGGHLAKFWIVKDIFRSRWKRFYKRSYRRSPLSVLDNRLEHAYKDNFAAPYSQGMYLHDGVPSPWRLQYSADLPTQPPDARRYGAQAYMHNFKRYLFPATSCTNPTGMDVILRSLDAGSHGGAISGVGKLQGQPAELGKKPGIEEKLLDRMSKETIASAAPRHLHRVIFDAKEDFAKSYPDRQKEYEDRRKQYEEGRLSEPPERLLGRSQPEDLMRKLEGVYNTSSYFALRRLYELCEEYELVWMKREDMEKTMKKPLLGEAKKDRGRFPYVDEQASLVEDMRLADILRIRHKIKRRRHPKWIEINYTYKKWHKQYLRRRQMNLDEVKAQMAFRPAAKASN